MDAARYFWISDLPVFVSGNTELFRYYLPFKFLYHYLPRERYHQMAQTIREAGHSHPGSHMPEIKGRFETILDVYDQFDPNNYVSF